MRKVILSMMVSLDGFIEGPDNDISWHVWNSEMDQYMGNFFQRIDTLLFGRHTYEYMHNYWPNVTTEDHVIAQYMNKLPKIIFSTTLDDVTWNSSVVKGNIPEQINRLKKQAGKDMVIFGGANLASSFMQLDLIDEYRIIVNPVVLGKGTPLFQNLKDRIDLKLIDAKTFACGNVVLSYKPTKKETNNRIHEEVKVTTDELLQLLTSLSEEQLNKVPYEGSWTAGQVGDHLLKSYGVVELLKGKTKPTEREIDQKVQELKAIFLNFDTKMESPDFIVPSTESIEKEHLLVELRNKINAIISFCNQDDLSATCLDFELPGTGQMTKLEWLYFINYHTQRHVHQLKKIIAKIRISNNELA